MDMKENRFKTARGYTVLHADAIIAYTTVIEQTPRRTIGFTEETFIDVHLVSGTVFTIQPDDVAKFQNWIETKGVAL